jgi:hypothetical protein
VPTDREAIGKVEMTGKSILAGLAGAGIQASRARPPARDRGRQGLRYMSGGGMAVFQAADAFRLFSAAEPDAERMLRHFGEME